MEPAASISKYVNRQSRATAYVQAVFLVLTIAFLDYVTGYEVAFFPFYSIPILLLVWRGDTSAAIGVSVLSAIAWWVTDVATGHVYEIEWLRAWDCVVHFSFFCLVVVAGTALKNRVDANRAQIELLRHSQELEEEIIEISEREQQRIGRDLHDGLCQHLASVGFAAAALKEKIRPEAPDCAEGAGDLARMIEDAVVRTREMARGLSPVDRDEGGLESALEELTAGVSRVSGVSCSFIGEPSELLLENDCAVDLYRIAQEALNNAVKHGRAKSVVIAVETCGDDLSLRISDDGVGIRESNPDQNGMGLNIMRYRARKIGGSLDFYENTPTGTVVSCTLKRTPRTNGEHP